MSADLIQAQYDNLEAVARQFARQAEATAQMQRRVERSMQSLKGGWQGKGSQAFFAEMDGKVKPVMVRLNVAMKEAQRTTLECQHLLRLAEEEAAAVFTGESNRVSSSSSATSSQSNENTGAAQGSIWDHVRVNGKTPAIEFDTKDGSRRKSGFNPEIKLTVGTEEAAVWGDPKKDGVAAVGGYVEAGARINKDGVMIGAGGEYYTVKGKADTAILGDKEYGVTLAGGFKAAGADGFAGVQLDGKDKRIGAAIGATLISAEGTVGGNIAGVNVGVTGEVGLKAELGFQIGKKTEIKLPFISFGITFGDGVD